VSAEIARAPVLGGSSDGKAAEAAEAVFGRGSEDSAEEEDHRVAAGYLPDRGMGSAIEVKEAFTGGGNGGGAQVSGEVLEGQDIAEAGNYSLGGLDLAMEVNQEIVHEDGIGEKLAKDSRLEKAKLAEGKNPSKEYVGQAAATLLNVTNASTSQDAAEGNNPSKEYVGRAAATLSNVTNVSTSQDATATEDKLEGAESGIPVDFSMEASGSTREVHSGFLRNGHLGESGSGSPSVEVDASEQELQLGGSDHLAVKNSSGASPDNLGSQDPNLNEEAVPMKMDLPWGSAAHCDVYDGNWVFDESYPFYTSNSCPFIDEGFSCEANGRTDRRYMKWRWQPKHCNIPRYLLH
jgi:hypothetical protein